MPAACARARRLLLHPVAPAVLRPAFRRLGCLVGRHPWKALLASLCVVGACASGLLRLESGTFCAYAYSACARVRTCAHVCVHVLYRHVLVTPITHADTSYDLWYPQRSQAFKDKLYIEQHFKMVCVCHTLCVCVCVRARGGGARICVSVRVQVRVCVRVERGITC